MRSELRRLVVVSHVVHYEHGGRLYAYGPYAREIDIWADLFAEVVIAAPLRREEPPPMSLPFTRANIAVAAQAEAGGDEWRDKVALLLSVPALVWGLCRTLARADAIHVRCPGNLGLLGVVLAPIFSRRLVAKYAGQWNGYAGEPVTVRLQRWILGSPWWRGPVTVYGEWPNQPSQVVPFFTSMMTAPQVEHAAAVAATKETHTPLRVLYAGVLTERKRVAALLDAVAIAINRGVRLELAIVGGGPERDRLERQAARLGLADLVRFIGALPFDETLAWYDWSDCLVLPSRHSEGWPKVVAEAMAHGVLPIAVNHGQVAAMVEGRGLLLESGSADEIADALQTVADSPGRCRELAARASAWACRYSLEGLRSALAALLSERWRLQPVLTAPRLSDDGTR